MPPEYLWSFLPKGYLFTIAIELPILLVGLSLVHSWNRKILAGLWLTACTYPMVVLVFPLMIDVVNVRWLYLLIAETFAPGAECLLFGLAFHRGLALVDGVRWRDYFVIILANLASFGLGELFH